MICASCNKEIMDEESIIIAKELGKYPNNLTPTVTLGSIRFHISCFEYMAGKDFIKQIDYDCKKKKVARDDILEAYNSIKQPFSNPNMRVLIYGENIICDRCQQPLCNGNCK
jgi:hypothetical protein